MELKKLEGIVMCAIALSKKETRPIRIILWGFILSFGLGVLLFGAGTAADGIAELISVIK